MSGMLALCHLLQSPALNLVHFSPYNTYLRPRCACPPPRYSSTFGDWDVSKGTDPNEAEILMYGGEMEHASVPLFVSSWHLGGDLRSGGVEDEYAPIKVKVACSDGTVYKEDEVRTTPDKVWGNLSCSCDALINFLVSSRVLKFDPHQS